MLHIIQKYQIVNYSQLAYNVALCMVDLNKKLALAALLNILLSVQTDNSSVASLYTGRFERQTIRRTKIDLA